LRVHPSPERAKGSWWWNEASSRFDWQQGEGYPLADTEKRLKAWKQWANHRT